MTDTPAEPQYKPRYQEHPRMFADEPGRFVLVCALIVAPAVVALFLWESAAFALPLLVVSVIGIVWLLWWYIVIRCTLLTVGEERILLSRGVFSKERVEIELPSIRTVEIDQTFVDRIFNVGILKIYTAGDQPELTQKGMPDPERLRSALRT